jgi:hypothetical protein
MEASCGAARCQVECRVRLHVLDIVINKENPGRLGGRTFPSDAGKRCERAAKERRLHRRLRVRSKKRKNSSHSGNAATIKNIPIKGCIMPRPAHAVTVTAMTPKRTGARNLMPKTNARPNVKAHREPRAGRSYHSRETPKPVALRCSVWLASCHLLPQCSIRCEQSRAIPPILHLVVYFGMNECPVVGDDRNGLQAKFSRLNFLSF